MTICTRCEVEFGSDGCNCLEQSFQIERQMFETAGKLERVRFARSYEVFPNPCGPGDIDYPAEFIRLSFDNGVLKEPHELPDGCWGAIRLARRMVELACIYLVQAGVHPEDAESELHNVAGCELEIIRGTIAGIYRERAAAESTAAAPAPTTSEEE